MPVVYDCDGNGGKGAYRIGTWDKGRFVAGKRLHWREMLTRQEQDLVEGVVRGGKLKDEERDIWRAIHERVEPEGWNGFRLVGKDVKGISLVSVYTDNWVPIRDRKKPDAGPLAPLLEEFVHED